MRTTAIFNLKGGVAKTTTTINMAAVLQRYCGKRVLVIDGDSQCNLTEFCGIQDAIGTLVDVIKCPKTASIGMVIHPTGFDGIHIIPAEDRIMALDLSAINGGKIDPNAIQKFLYRVQHLYDYCLIDCPAAFNAAAAAALVAADDVVIPIKLDAFSLRGMGNLMQQVHNMQALNPHLDVAGLLPTMYYKSDRTAEAQKVLAYSDFRIFTAIRQSRKVDDMTYAQKPLCLSSPTCAAAVDYRRFVAMYLGGTK